MTPLVVDWAEEAQNHLLAADEPMAALCRRFGLVRLSPGTHLADELVRSVIAQQISRHAATVILQRVRQVAGHPFDPKKLLAASDETLRGCGLSAGKIRTLRTLAEAIVSGDLAMDSLREVDDETAVQRLTKFYGIGPWTAQCFLFFGLARPDVLVAGDLAIRKAVQKVYGLSAMPSEKEVRERALASGWHPFASAASHYLWEVTRAETP